MRQIGKRIALLLLAIGLSSTPAPAQAYNGNYDETSIAAFEQDINQPVLPFEGFLLDVANGLTDALGILLFVTVLFFNATGHGGELNYRAIFAGFILPFVFVKYLLAHWLVPITGLSYSFSGAFSATAVYLAQHVQTQTVQTLEATVYGIQDQLGPGPSIFNPNWWTFQVVQLVLTVFQFPSFFVLAYSVIARTMGICIGPIFLVTKLVPSLNWIWTGWVRTMIKFTLFPVFTAIYVAAVSAYFTGFLKSVFTFDFTLESIAPKLSEIIIMALVFGITGFKIPHLAADFTAGAATSGHGVFGAVVSSFGRFIKK